MFRTPGFYNVDCMDMMREFPDNYFDLAIVDPPYGAGGNKAFDGRFGGKGSRFQKYRASDERISEWDVAPNQEYFDELWRVSKNQIIWGGNYFQLPPTRCFVVWRKLTISEKFSMAMAEYAWTSFTTNAKIFSCAPQSKQGDKRFHPCQKPIELYEWLLKMYAKPGDKILDTHVGSASSIIACIKNGFSVWGTEINSEYYEKAKERISRMTAQTNIWENLNET